MDEGKGYLTTPSGLIHIFCIIGNAATVLVCGLKWSNKGDVYLQIIHGEFLWQSFVMLCLLLAFFLAFVPLMAKLSNPASMIAQVARKMSLALVGFCVILVLICAAIELWYVTSAPSSASRLYKRMVVVMICCVVLVVLYVIFACFLGISSESSVRPSPNVRAEVLTPVREFKYQPHDETRSNRKPSDT